MTTDPSPTGAPSADGLRLGSLSRILRNTSINLTAILVGNLLAVVVLVKRVGPDVLGRYYLIFSLIMVTQLVVEAGLATMLTNRIVGDFGRWRQTAAEACGLMLVVCVISMLALLAVGAAWRSAAGEPALLPVFIAAGAACVGLQLQTFCAGVFRAFERFELESLAKLLQAFAFVGLLIWLVDGTPGDLLRSVGAFAASNLLAGLLMCAGCAWTWGRLGCRLNTDVLRDWLCESVPVGLGDVCRRVTLQTDTILLGVMAPFAAAGIYNLAYRPLGFLRLIPRVILTVLFPSFSQLARDSREELDRALGRSIRLLWAGSLPVVAAVVVCADRLVLLIGNQQYAAAALPMRLLVWVVAMSFVSTQFRFYLTALGRQGVFTRLAAAVLVLETLLIAVSIPLWGYLGACYAVLTGEAVFLAAGFWACHRLGLRGVEWAALGKAALLAFAMTAALWAVRDAAWMPQLLWCLAGMVGYVVASLAWGVLQPAELGRLVEVLGKCPERPLVDTTNQRR